MVRRLYVALSAAYLKFGGKRLVMKTPANAARLKLLTRLFPDARYVYIGAEPTPNLVSLDRGSSVARGVGTTR